MSFETLELNVDDSGVATLTLNRPDKHNAMSAQMLDELTTAVDVLGSDSAVRVVVLAAAGGSFCAGGDLGWMREQFDATREKRMAEARKLANMLQALNTLPKPLIGKVQGPAYGGGIGMMSVCDVVVAVDDARFGLTETRLGLIPATISPYVLARMGEGRARRVFMSARLFGADEAKDLGLVSTVVSSDALDAAIEAEIKPYMNVSPDAVAAAKALARSLGPVVDEAVIEETVSRLADCWEHPAAMEGIGAFFDKRKPSWV
jgi:methylglutaconyl-CoA hydratase